MDNKDKAEIKKILHEIDGQIDALSEKLDQIWNILDFSEEEDSNEYSSNEQNTTEKSSNEINYNLDDSDNNPNGQNMDDIPIYNEDPGSCSLCGNPLVVLSRSPYIVECSNPRCTNRFNSKYRSD